MKAWAEDHPKAKLMALKRVAILAAAKDAFLATGYEGTSMESIARAADVSIMTLYRHARTKDDLFSAVIANACDPTDEAELAEMSAVLAKPLHGALVAAGLKAQDRLIEPDTIALMRTVIAEATRFPNLAEMAHASLVGNLVAMAAFVIEAKIHGEAKDDVAIPALAARFIDRLLGGDMLGVLLGLPGPSEEKRRERALAAADDLVATLR